MRPCKTLRKQASLGTEEKGWIATSSAFLKSYFATKSLFMYAVDHLPAHEQLVAQGW